LSREDDPRWHSLIKLCAEKSALLQWQPVVLLQREANIIGDNDDNDEDNDVMKTRRAASSSWASEDLKFRVHTLMVAKEGDQGEVGSHNSFMCHITVFFFK
jgi:hypothetical protein